MNNESLREFQSVSIPAAHALCVDVLVRHGMSFDDAQVAAGVLVRTTARGFRSHGIELLPMYVRWIESGAVRPCAVPRMVSQTPVSAVLDGDGGLGHVVASAATKVAIDKARTSGIGMVVVRNSNHLGATGHYALTCAESSLIGMVWSSAPPTIHAVGGRGRRIGNGPTAYGVPRAPQPPIVFDAAMSVGSGGKVAMARARGQALPEGWIVDSAGRPSTSPADASAGAFTPVGAHKGFGLALLAEILSSCLSGALLSGDLPSMATAPTAPFGLGSAFLAIDPGCFGEQASFTEQVLALSVEITDSDPVDPAQPVRLPGDAAHDRELAAQQDGIIFDFDVWAGLTRLRE